ncbi:D-alanyl-D-alanine carboxypeptidase family protein [Coprobacillus sp. AF33-1AC]|uniref:D-alanyl-D-alanine carboxypeptidase family protein n=1 Tax=Coprobacillus sp. AF33-1AC TaxID=2292032 RepID=UPI000E4D39F3|nr:D-alanyl-D-alanine carboxypeptidase family protein [Coprobacillus sp. AF33-1AC]RHM61722.1 D-alanyl-D-alanine carboxypeptidase [Coprobacillus sp. AF33-1AC]
MFKKIFCSLVVSFMMICHVQKIEALSLIEDASSAILIDCESQQVLYQKNETKKLYPASTTKIMTMILLFEAIDQHTLKWNDVLTCSEYASSMGGSQVYLEPNETMSVKDLFKSIAIASANDACVVVGEAIGGSHEHFVEMMNKKAKELQLVNTHFVNATGLHDPSHYTCAKDLATMGAYLIKIGGKRLFAVTSLYDSYIREKTNKKFWLVNTNKLLKQYPGVDGLKTGYTKEAGYCIVTTCKKNNMRLLGVLMNEALPKQRNEDMCKMLNYGYSHYQRKQLIKKETVIDQKKINHYMHGQIDVIVKDNISYLKMKSDHQKVTCQKKYYDLTLPIRKGQVIGKLEIKKGSQVLADYPLYSKQTIIKQNYFQRVYEIYKRLI